MYPSIRWQWKSRTGDADCHAWQAVRNGLLPRRGQMNNVVQ